MPTWPPRSWRCLCVSSEWGGCLCVSSEWTDLDDSDGDAEGLFDDLSALWAEAILTADLSPAERQTWAERLADWHTEAAEYGIDAAFEAAQAAAVQGWDDPELQRMLRGEVASSESETAWAESGF